jgi:hypothetical protein
MKTWTLAAALLLSFAARSAVAEPCADVVFQPEDPPVSRAVRLSGGVEDRTVRLILRERPPLLPWESDVFKVCLTGANFTMEPVSTAYDYRVVGDGAFDGNVVLAAGPKRALPPDPRGIQAGLTPSLSLVFEDRWAAYYQGEDVVLRVALMKEGPSWPDETVARREVALPVAQTYAMDFSGAARARGGVYYAAYSIRRLGGRVSTEDDTPVLKTGEVSYALRAAAP